MTPPLQKKYLTKKGDDFPAGILTGAKVAFFDLDETITNLDTDGLWSRWRLLHARGGLREVIAVFSLLHSYRKGTMDANRYLAYHKMRVSSLTREEYEQLADAFFEQRGRRHILPEAETILRYYRDRSVPTILITAQNEVIARRFSSFLDMDGLAANAFDYERGKYTSPVTPYCFREGKIEYARRFAEEYSITLKECAFYSDSINDLPLLELVGFPVVINPDTLLKKEARKRDWPLAVF